MAVNIALLSAKHQTANTPDSVQTWDYQGSDVRLADAEIARPDSVATEVFLADREEATAPRGSGGAKLPTIAGYEIAARPIGRGGFSDVWRAVDARGRQVAVKVLRIDWARQADARDSFAAEVDALAALRHENILPLLDTGTTDDGRPFVAMPLVEGLSLRTAIREAHEHDRANAAGQTEKLLHLVRQLLTACEAVAAAHRQGLLHLDLKPDNILLHRDGTVLVIDWGLSGECRPTTVGGEISGRSTTCFGTPGFVSPERMELASWQPTVRDDVYALGATLYTIVTGQAPHTRTSVPACPTKVDQPASSGNAQPSGISAKLLEIATTAMNHAAADRQASVEQFTAAVRAVVAPA